MARRLSEMQARADLVAAGVAHSHEVHDMVSWRRRFWLLDVACSGMEGVCSMLGRDKFCYCTSFSIIFVLVGRRA
jgi:hypothetical protein